MKTLRVENNTGKNNSNNTSVVDTKLFGTGPDPAPAPTFQRVLGPDPHDFQKISDPVPDTTLNN
jgi:hypothetical protein